MKKYVTILLLFMMIPLCNMAQENGIKAVKENTQKEVFFQENKRIRVKNAEGKKYRGKFEIIDQNHIKIKNEVLAISDLVSIKRNPLLQSVGLNGLLIYAGAVTIGVAVIIAAVVGETQALWLIIPAYGLMYAGGTSINILKAYKLEKGWNYQIILNTP